MQRVYGILGKDVAGVELVRALARGLGGIARIARAACRLKRGGGQRPQQLGQVRTTLDATHADIYLTPPACCDFHANQLLEQHRNIAARLIRAVVGLRFGVVDDHVQIDRESDPHVMDRVAGLTRRLAAAARMHHSFGIDEVRFDIPQAVLALVADAIDGAFVDGFAGLRVGEGHDGYWVS